MKNPITIEELEAVLSGTNSDLKVEIKPDGSIHAYHNDEPREQGPVRILSASELNSINY